MARMTKGLRDVQRNMQRAIRGVQGRTIEGLRDGADFLGDVAEPNIPIQTGALRKSREVATNSDPNAPEAAIGYTAPYAVIVHERLDLNHPVGEAKFLERAAMNSANQRGVLERVAAKAKVR